MFCLWVPCPRRFSEVSYQDGNCDVLEPSGYRSSTSFWPHRPRETQVMRELSSSFSFSERITSRLFCLTADDSDLTGTTDALTTFGVEILTGSLESFQEALIFAGVSNSSPVEFLTTVKALFLEGSMKVVEVKGSRRIVSSGQPSVASRIALGSGPGHRSAAARPAHNDQRTGGYPCGSPTAKKGMVPKDSEPCPSRVTGILTASRHKRRDQ